jgi:hypothetical protein
MASERSPVENIPALIRISDHGTVGTVDRATAHHIYRRASL